MNNHQRRVKTIELTLTPEQIVFVWLRNAVQAGTFVEGARHSPPSRGLVADAVYETVRNSMKGHPELLIERAILQARREADLLYMLILNANMSVLESAEQSQREHFLLCGYFYAALNGKPTRESIEHLRKALLLFIEPIVLLDAAIAQLVAGPLKDHPMLFRDSEEKLAEQLEMATQLSTGFNQTIVLEGSTEIDMEQLRTKLQSEVIRKTAIWVSLARFEMLKLFGTIEEQTAAIDRHFRLIETNITMIIRENHRRSV
jgi:hypothetical protein